MSMTITYEVGNSLYLNITNRCSNNCSFCIRSKFDGMGDANNLWLEHEPTIDEVIEDIHQRDIGRYQEIVFCGFGEPMMRTFDIIEICKKLKERYNVPIRINTNGQANLICGEDITPQLEGLVDIISISMNASNTNDYQLHCQSVYGENAFKAVLDFAAQCKKYIPKVVLTVVDTIANEEIRACQEIAEGIGVDFRVRHLID